MKTPLEELEDNLTPSQKKGWEKTKPFLLLALKVLSAMFGLDPKSGGKEYQAGFMDCFRWALDCAKSLPPGQKYDEEDAVSLALDCSLHLAALHPTWTRVGGAGAP